MHTAQRRAETAEPKHADELLRGWHGFQEFTGMDPLTARRAMARDPLGFPPVIRLTPRKVCFRIADVRAWMERLARVDLESRAQVGAGS